MKVLLLSPHSEIMEQAIEAEGDTSIPFDWLKPPEEWPEEIDYIVSFGYRHIIKGEILQKYRGRMINIHISVLPYNRGAAPNFWSWFDGTPKGVSIHMIDEGIDTGHVIFQYELEEKMFRYGENATLQTTYNDLTTCALGMFNRGWRTIKIPRPGSASPRYGHNLGTFHKKGQEEYWLKLLGTPGYGARVKDIERLGMIYRKGAIK